MKITNVNHCQSLPMANSDQFGRPCRKGTLLFIAWAIFGTVYSAAAISQENGVVVSHYVSVHVQASAYPTGENAEKFSDDAEYLDVGTTIWGHQYAQPDEGCNGSVNAKDHPRCPWTAHSADIRNMRLQYATNRSGAFASAEITAQITDMGEKEFRVAGQYEVRVEVDGAAEWMKSGNSSVDWSMLVTIKRPMKVIISNCSIFDTRFLPIQYFDKGRNICVFKIREIDKYDVSLPVPNVGSAVPDVELPAPDISNMPEMDEEAMKALMGQLDALGVEVGDEMQWIIEQMGGNGEPNDEIWSQPAPNDEIWQQAQAPALTPEVTGRNLESLPPPPRDWIPEDFIEDRITAENHDSYERRRAGDPEALAEQQEFLDWLEVMNSTTSGRQLRFFLNSKNDHVFVGAVPDSSAHFEEKEPVAVSTKERFTISIRPL